jgi:small subunit ribosomal protein S15
LSITPEKTKELVQDFGLKSGDTGSPEVQIAILTTRIQALTGHLTTYKKDFSARRGLMVMVGQRRRLLRYLLRQDKTRHSGVIQKLGIRA